MFEKTQAASKNSKLSSASTLIAVVFSIVLVAGSGFFIYQMYESSVDAALNKNAATIAQDAGSMLASYNAYSDELHTQIAQASTQAVEDKLASKLESAGFVGAGDDYVLANDLSVVLSKQGLVQTEDGRWVYQIQPGDDLSSISYALGYSVDVIAEANNIRDVNLIYSNSSLYIPVTD